MAEPAAKRSRVAWIDDSTPVGAQPQDAEAMSTVSTLPEIPVAERPLWIAPAQEGEGGTIYLENHGKHYAEAYDLVITVAEPVSRQRLIQEFRIDKYPLYGAASTGKTAKSLVEELRRFSKNSMPASVESFIYSMVGQYGHVRAVLYQNRRFLVCKTRSILDTLLQDTTIQASVIYRPEPFRGAGGGGLEEPVLGLTADGQQARAVEIQPKNMYGVMEQCLKHRYPVVAEYQFEDDTTTADLKIQLGKNTCVRPYQEKALQKMCKGNRARSGLIVLACGAGKTLVGIAATCRLKKSTVVLATAAVSVEQWKKEYKRWADIEDKDIFLFTSDTPDEEVDKFCSDDAGKLVIATYSMMMTSGQRSAKSQRILDAIRSRAWGLLVLDEVHVFPADRVSDGVQTVNAHCMLGLTATLVREDSRIENLNYMIGPKLYEANWLDLVSQGYLANVQCAEVRCAMPERFYREYLNSTSGEHASRMRDYLQAVNPAKFNCAQFLVRYHEARNDKIIVFCDTVRPLKFYAEHIHGPDGTGAPRGLIHGATPEEERLNILDRFQKATSAMTLFLSRVGDNSIDLPDANVVIEISWLNGSRRQEAQRLGRILRPKRRSEAGDAHNAFFYALINSNTDEVGFSARRQSFLVDQGYSYKIITNLVENHRDAVPGPLDYESPEKQAELLEDVRRMFNESLSGMPESASSSASSSAASSAALRTPSPVLASTWSSQQQPQAAVRKTGNLSALSAPRAAVYSETRTPTPSNPPNRW